MTFRKHIRPTVAVADQPTEDDLRTLKEEGFVGVVNLRREGEPEQPLSPAEEGEKARALGMDYLHYPVGGEPLTTEGVNGVRDFIDAHEKKGKVLVHCRKGGRAAGLLLIDSALREGWKEDEVFERGKAIGLEVDGPALKTSIENYLRDSRRA